jgi:3-oxoadipate enol-lactonase
MGRVSFGDSGDGALRVALHSLLTDRNAFQPVTAPIGGRLISVDLPGFGSTGPAEPDIDDYAHRVGAFLEAVGPTSDGVTLIGNGLGAFVALGTAIHHGDLFDRLLLIGCGAAFPDQAKAVFTSMIEAVSFGGVEAVIPVALRRIYTDGYLAENPEKAEERAEVLRQTDVAAFVTACTALVGLDYTVAARSVTNPTMILVGEDDAATPPAMAEDLHRRITGSKLVRMPGVAHAPQLQDPAGFVAATRAFLEGR